MPARSRWSRVVDPRRPVDRAALGHRAGRHDLSAGGARRRGAMGPRPGAARRRRPRRSPTISSSPSRSTRSASTAPPTSSPSSSCSLVALVTSRLAAGIREPGAACRGPRRAQRDHRRLRRGACCRAAARRTSRGAACAELRRLFDCNAMLVGGLPAPRVVAAVPTGNRLTPSDIAAAALAIETGEPAGRGTPRHPAGRMAVPPGPLAARRCSPRRASRATTARRRSARTSCRCSTNLLDQLALALERARLEGEARDVRRGARARPAARGAAVVDRPGRRRRG